MRVLKRGNVPKRYPDGVVVTCGFCSSEYVLERGDPWKPLNGYQDHEQAIVTTCPICGDENTTPRKES